MYKYKVEYQTDGKVRTTLKYLNNPLPFPLSSQELYKELEKEAIRLHHIVNGTDYPVTILSVEELSD